MIIPLSASDATHYFDSDNGSDVKFFYKKVDGIEYFQYDNTRTCLNGGWRLWVDSDEYKEMVRPKMIPVNVKEKEMKTISTIDRTAKEEKDIFVPGNLVELISDDPEKVVVVLVGGKFEDYSDGINGTNFRGTTLFCTKAANHFVGFSDTTFVRSSFKQYTGSVNLVSRED